MASPKMKKLNLRMSRNELRDIEFLASVDRFPFVVPAEDIDDQWTDDDDNDSNEMPTQDYYWRPYLNMLDLTQENRGVIKDAFQEGSPCSIHFLRCIKFNLLAMTMDFALSTDKDVIFSRISLDRCNPDLARLYGHPELFPSESMERAFREDVSSICSLFLQIASITEKASGLQQDVFDATEEFVNDMILPVRDKHRKLWQQFLHKNAPGSGIDDSFRREGMATTQVVPLSALELRASMRSERASVFKDLIANDRNPASSQATASTYAKITMENNIRTSWLQFGALPPFPRRPTVLKALATIKGDSTSLEELNVRFNILKDTGRARYRPRILGRATTIIQDEKVLLG